MSRTHTARNCKNSSRHVSEDSRRQGRGDGPEAGTSGASEAARVSCRLGSPGPRYITPSPVIFENFKNFKCHIVRISAKSSYAASADIMKIFITAQFTLVQTAKRGLAIAYRPPVRPSVLPSVCLSVTFVNCDHIG